jgi:tetratricopeptide (TPR) repeat protein
MMNPTRNRILTSALWLLAVATFALPAHAVDVSAPPQQADPDLPKKLAACQHLVNIGHQREAYPVLNTLYDHMDSKNPDPQICALLARTALLEHATAKAWQFIKPWAEHPPNLHLELTRAYLAVADTLLAGGAPEKSRALYNWIAAQLDNTKEPEEIALATEGYGMSSAHLKDIPEAIRSLEFALSIAKTLPDPKGNDLWLINRIESELAMLRPRGPATPAPQNHDADLYGPDFVLFRQAETFRRAMHDYVNADGVYRDLIKKFPDAPYVEPSILYDALCYVNVGRATEGEKQIAEFIKKFPNSLYKGEALLELGRIQLEYHLDPNPAQKCFNELDKWIDSARQPGAPQTELKVREAAKAVTTPAQQQYTDKDFWGKVRKQSVAPGQLVNAKTTPWYLDDLAAQSAKLNGFILFTQGKKKEALAAYQKLLELDPEAKVQEASDDWNDYRRLKWALDHGYFSAYPQELALYNDRQRFVVLIGDLYYCSTDFDKGAEIYRRLLKGEFGNLSQPQQDYPRFGLASCLYRARWNDENFAGNRDAIAELEKVILRADGSSTYRRCCLAYFNLSYIIPDENIRAKGRRVLESLAGTRINDQYTYYARISLARKLVEEGKVDQGIAIFNRFSEADGAFYALAVSIEKRCIDRHNREMGNTSKGKE